MTIRIAFVLAIILLIFSTLGIVFGLKDSKSNSTTPDGYNNVKVYYLLDDIDGNELLTNNKVSTRDVLYNFDQGDVIYPDDLGLYVVGKMLKKGTVIYPSMLIKRNAEVKVGNVIYKLLLAEVDKAVINNVVDAVDIYIDVYSKSEGSEKDEGGDPKYLYRTKLKPILKNIKVISGNIKGDIDRHTINISVSDKEMLLLQSLRLRDIQLVTVPASGNDDEPLLREEISWPVSRTHLLAYPRTVPRTLELRGG